MYWYMYIIRIVFLHLKLINYHANVPKSGENNILYMKDVKNDDR